MLASMPPANKLRCMAGHHILDFPKPICYHDRNPTRRQWPALEPHERRNIMHGSDYLFPNRLTRRDFLRTTGIAAVGLAAPAVGIADDKKEPVRVGSGRFTYVLDENWGKLPEGMKYGFGCAVVVDSKDRVIVTSRSANPCVAIFDKNGQLLETWSKELSDKVGYTTQQIAATAHGLYWN